MAASGTGFVYHPDYLKHETGYGHPERPERVSAIYDRFDRQGLLSRLTRIEPRPALIKELERVHPRSHIEMVERACSQGPMYLDPDTHVSRESYRVALLAAGGILAACDAVMDKKVRNAFCAVRPPGHHAETARAMGFCLFNNIAVAARHLQSRHGISRIAIIDWDVHHGNGTEEIFREDDSVLYASVHQFPYYPGTGAASEGRLLNIPMNPGAGDGEFLLAFQEKVLPGLREFKPGFILISAGFDAHLEDPLAELSLSSNGYGLLTRLLMQAASELCESRIVSALEGGYDLPALAESAERHVEALLS